MRILGGVTALAVFLVAGVASANPGAVAIAGAVSQAVGVGEGGAGGAGGAGGTGYGGESTGIGGGGSGSGEGGDASSKDSSTTIGAALGQAPSAITGICGKDNKFVFGVVQWSDFSSKCFNYMIAIEAAKKGEWNLANEWVVRADQM